MATRHRFIDNPDRLSESVDTILHQIQYEAEPDEMNEYRAFFKKHVSIFRRAYFTGYILKLIAEGRVTLPQSDRSATAKRRPDRADRAERARSRKDEREAKRQEKRRDTRPQKDASQDESAQTPAIEGEVATLFVSVGKNRRVYPKDLIGLFATTEGAGEVAFGQIKILDNYSFVEVNAASADALIAVHDGTEFRGRKLTVNFARSKK